MTQSITVNISGTAATVIANGKVSDPAGNLWDLPASVTILSTGLATVTATADVQSPDAVFPGSGVKLTIETPVAGWAGAATPDKITPVEFRSNFNAFANTSDYTDPQIQFWLNTAYTRLPECVWNELLDTGVQLYAAHNLSLEHLAQQASANGIAPGNNSGPLNSKSVDKVSAGYDSATASMDVAGNYNMTTYGTRFYELVKIVGAGAFQIGTGDNNPGWGYFAWQNPAWPWF